MLPCGGGEGIIVLFVKGLWLGLSLLVWLCLWTAKYACFTFPLPGLGRVARVGWIKVFHSPASVRLWLNSFFWRWTLLRTLLLVYVTVIPFPFSLQDGQGIFLLDLLWETGWTTACRTLKSLWGGPLMNGFLCGFELRLLHPTWSIFMAYLLLIISLYS